ncbi:MAG: hypothetical protein NC301_04725 [Bacteroides sp.]|nr:hypothetical protein [Bacteroides sp.]MCM1378510.1 hypothetical protein [Bacteroides sp.]MCM1444811.1 hypothetical protein [Prevotella sp.]
MITIDNINNLYNKYNNLAANADVCTERNLNNLMMQAFDSDHLDFDGDRISFTKGSGPLKSVEIERIAGYEDLGSHMAIVMPNSIIFVNKKDGNLQVFLAE